MEKKSNPGVDESFEAAALVRARTLLHDCVGVLNRLETTCCTPERSPRMRAAFGDLEGALRSVDSGAGDTLDLNKTLDYIDRCGFHIGGLYATCCTEKREPLYQELLANLNKAYRELMATAGLEH